MSGKGEYVLLPIYDAQGVDTGKAVQIALFRLTATFGMHAQIVDNIDVAEEIEVLDRIVSGLHPRENPWREYNKEHGVGEFAMPEADDRWRVIPEFSKYIINRRGMVAEKDTEKTVSVNQGPNPNVLLVDDDGKHKRMSIRYLLITAFPKSNP